MTVHKLRRVEPDGTHVYSNYTRYRPKPVAERKNGVNRPDDPRAVRFHTKWFLPLDLLPDEARAMPETRPDTDAYDHMAVTALCQCQPCMRPQAARWRKKWLRDQR